MFSVKGQIVSILGFVIWKVSTAATLVCLCSMKAVVDKMQMNGCLFSNKTLLTKVGSGLDLICGLQFTKQS